MMFIIAAPSIDIGERLCLRGQDTFAKSAHAMADEYLQRMLIILNHVQNFRSSSTMWRTGRHFARHAMRNWSRERRTGLCKPNKIKGIPPVSPIRMGVLRTWLRGLLYPRGFFRKGG